MPPLNVEHMPRGELRARLLALRAIVIHGIADLWLAPDPSLSEWRRILLDYGLAFDGYRYARLVLGVRVARSPTESGGASRSRDSLPAPSLSCAAPCSGCSAACTTMSRLQVGRQTPSLRLTCIACTGRFRKPGTGSAARRRR